MEEGEEEEEEEEEVGEAVLRPLVGNAGASWGLVVGPLGGLVGPFWASLGLLGGLLGCPWGLGGT